MNNEHLTLTVKQFAGRMQVSLPTAYTIVNQEGFPKIYAGRKILIPSAQLERWLDRQACGEAAQRGARGQ